ENDLALHDAGKMILDCGMDIRHVKCDGQPTRKGVEVAQVNLALARHLELPLEAAGELAHHHRHENEQCEIDDLLGVGDAEAEKGRIKEEGRGKYPAYRRGDSRHDSPTRCRDDDRYQVNNGTVLEAVLPDEDKQHGGQNADQADRHGDAMQFLPDVRVITDVLHCRAAGRSSCSGAIYAARPLSVLTRLVT